MNKHDKTRYVFAQAIKGLIKVHPLDKIAVTDCPKFFSMMFL